MFELRCFVFLSFFSFNNSFVYNDILWFTSIISWCAVFIFEILLMRFPVQWHKNPNVFKSFLFFVCSFVCLQLIQWSGSVAVALIIISSTQTELLIMNSTDCFFFLIYAIEWHLEALYFYLGSLDKWYTLLPWNCSISASICNEKKTRN